MWKQANNTLSKTFTFLNFNEAFGFMTRVALIVEKLDHHPSWKNNWNMVEITLSTHSAGNIVTEKDHKLAKEIDKLI